MIPQIHRNIGRVVDTVDVISYTVAVPPIALLSNCLAADLGTESLFLPATTPHTTQDHGRHQEEDELPEEGDAGDAGEDPRAGGGDGGGQPDVGPVRAGHQGHRQEDRTGANFIKKKRKKTFLGRFLVSI